MKWNYLLNIKVFSGFIVNNSEPIVQAFKKIYIFFNLIPELNR